MTDLKQIVTECENCIIFRDIVRSDAVVGKLIETIYSLSGLNNDDDGADCVSPYRRHVMKNYCGFIDGLYAETENLTQYVLDRILESDNIYIRRRAAGKPAGELLEECLANELWVLGRLAQLPCYELLDRMNYDGFLPRYRTEEVDFSMVYATRMKQLDKYGYGIYARYNMFSVRDGAIIPVKSPDPVRLTDFSGYERERGEVIENTLALLKGLPANNVLLYGDCGTGKSSTVKAIANEYAKDGLRLIELKKKQLHELPEIVTQIADSPLKFIIFIDDLSFTEDDDDFAALKAILEGSIDSKADNLCIYATSNRRHLVRETFSARRGDEVHAKDTMQELYSLADRFGITVTFVKPDKSLYLQVVTDLAKRSGVDMPEEELLKRAEVFALSRAGRSPRAARQFVDSLAIIGNE